MVVSGLPDSPSGSGHHRQIQLLDLGELARPGIRVHPVSVEHLDDAESVTSIRVRSVSAIRATGAGAALGVALLVSGCNGSGATPPGPQQVTPEPAPSITTGGDELPVVVTPTPMRTDPSSETGSDGVVAPRRTTPPSTPKPTNSDPSEIGPVAPTPPSIPSPIGPIVGPIAPPVAPSPSLTGRIAPAPTPIPNEIGPIYQLSPSPTPSPTTSPVLTPSVSPSAGEVGQ